MKDHVSDPLADRFGPLARHLFDDAPLAAAWRLSFLANFFTGPAYAWLQAEQGLGRPGFVVLYCLSERDGLMARDVVQVSGLPKNSVSRAVNELIARGLVTVGEGGFDRRAKPLRLTPEGAAILERVLPRFEARQAAMLAPLSAEERETLHVLLSRLSEGLPAWVDAGEDARPESPVTGGPTA